MIFLKKLHLVFGVGVSVGCGVLTAQEEAVDKIPPLAEPVKLLTIGNSFSRDSTDYLPGFATAGGKDLLMFKANPGGWTLERHAGWLREFRRNPTGEAGRPYPSAFVPVRDEPEKKYSLPEILAEEDWDYVTIQQLSNLSFKPESFEPHAKQIIECIREFAPGAEILIHQTWAYREDYPGFANVGFSQEIMFDQLEAAYGGLARKYGLRVIPVGKAFQEARSLPRWDFEFPDPIFNYKAPEPGTEPDQTGSLNVGWWIQKIVKDNPEAVKLSDDGAKGDADVPGAEIPAEIVTYKSVLDFKHCNAEGKYLGAAVWYGFLFSDTASPDTFVPPEVKPEDATVLRGIADRVLSEQKQVVSPKEN